MQRHNGNWIINLLVLLCNLNIIISQPCNSNNDTDNDLPQNWPCQWNTGKIPFMFNFYSMSTNRKRLISLVRSAHAYIEARSCLVFEEYNPLIWAKMKNFTYVYYIFSGALENCCLRYYKKPVGRRMVLITPICNMPGEIAHATLHGMGLSHPKSEPFNEYNVKSILFSNDCENTEEKMNKYLNIGI